MGAASTILSGRRGDQGPTFSQTEVRQLDVIGGALAQKYAEYGDWQFLRHNPRRWFHLLSDIYGRSAPDRSSRTPQDHPWPPRDEMPDGGPGPRPHLPPPLPGEILLLGRRLSVLDMGGRASQVPDLGARAARDYWSG